LATQIRGALNAIRLADQEELKTKGAVTASAGNMGQGVAYVAKALGVACTVIVPDTGDLMLVWRERGSDWWRWKEVVAQRPREPFFSLLTCVRW
jgi:hypothetical protein